MVCFFALISLHSAHVVIPGSPGVGGHRGGGGFRPGSKNQDQKNDRFFLGSEAKLSHLRHKSQNIKQ